MFRIIRSHWPEYLSEATLLALFMISASGFTILLEHPSSPVVAALPDPFSRRMLIGIAMGLTALTLILSPLGKRSGAHFNPAVTLTYWRLGTIRGWDALFYVTAQFLGGAAGISAVSLVVPHLLSDRTVNYVATQPGTAGVAAAFAAEFAISFLLMLVVLAVSNHRLLARYTPFFAAILVATFITFEAPLSGMSMNPARTFGSAFVGHTWTAFWIYLTAPVLAMQLAALIYRLSGRVTYCAKMHHHNGARCIFNCTFWKLERATGRKAVKIVGRSHESQFSSLFLHRRS